MDKGLAQRLQRLEDAEAIRNLIAHYGPLADSGDAVAVAALWTSDGVYDVGGYGVAKGRDAIAALISGDTHQALMRDGCAHILSGHHIELDGDRATATGYSMVVRKTDAGFETWRVSRNQWHLARQRDGRWLACERINRPVGPHQR